MRRSRQARRALAADSPAAELAASVARGRHSLHSMLLRMSTADASDLWSVVAPLEQMMDLYVAEVVRRVGSKAVAADMLGLDVRSVYRRLARCGAIVATAEGRRRARGMIDAMARRAS